MAALKRNGWLHSSGIGGRFEPEYAIWQRRFWEHVIRDDEDYAAHIDYCHINPMKNGLVNRVAEWPYSTFHRYVEQGLYPLDWAASPSPSIGFVEDERG